MSPYLFAICMEYLSRLFGRVNEDRVFSYHPRYKMVGLTHLLFIDDLLVFCKGDVKFVRVVANVAKIDVYLARV